MRKYFFHPLAAVICAFTLAAVRVEAQSFNYQDEAGNIYFVDRIEDVPMQYRSQVLPPKPTLPPGSKAARQYESELKKIEKQKERDRKKKEKEKAKEQKRLEKEKKKKEREEARKKKSDKK